jgi:4-hydroxybenzoate polyprenyltransferase
LSKFVRAFYYGNIFLGFCAVALCIETNLINQLSLNIFPFYLLIFFCTVIYYTRIYVRSVRTRNFNERTLWYSKNLRSIKASLKVAVVVSVVSLILLVTINLHRLLILSPGQILLITAFPVVAGWYTFTPSAFKLITIRQVGWMKPFVVGLTWAGWVTIYPVIIWQVQRNQLLSVPITPLVLLCLQNFLFFSINAIIFDIKDYRTDSYHHLKTYPVVFGVRNTFRFIVLPLTILNLVIFFLFQLHHNFTFLQILIQLIPYILLVFMLVRYRNGRSVLYYLAAVDGLVFLKAFCGITSILLIKK